jgi:hypothetical protein
LGQPIRRNSFDKTLAFFCHKYIDWATDRLQWDCFRPPKPPPAASVATDPRTPAAGRRGELAGADSPADGQGGMLPERLLDYIHSPAAEKPACLHSL